MDGQPADATVHLRLARRMREDDLNALRQQLAACLGSGVTDIRVHVDEHEDLDLEVLRTLHGAGEYLRRRGGAVTLVGAQRRVLTKIAINELGQLLGRTRGAATAPALRERVPAGRPLTVGSPSTTVPQEQLT